jgi:hypothetical protein
MAAIAAESLQDWTQIINGKEIILQSPISSHQIILYELNDIFKAFRNIEKVVKFLISPLDVILEEGVNRV